MTTDPTVSQTVLSVQHPTLGFSLFNMSYYYSAGNALWCVVIEDTLTNSATGCENVINGQQDGASRSKTSRYQTYGCTSR